MFFNRKCKITFICCGATVYSEEARLTDSEKYPPLSEYGQEEIEKICDFLKQRGIKNDKIYSSPAARATQSAGMISKLFKKDFEIIDDLHPRKCGSFNGLTFEQIAEKYPDALENLVNRPDIPTPEDAEAITPFIQRVKSSVNKIINENTGKRIIVVTHRDVIKAAVCSALNLPDTALYRLYIKSGSATQISYFENWASLMYCDYKPM